jgi:hypothetical protein
MQIPKDKILEMLQQQGKGHGSNGERGTFAPALSLFEQTRAGCWFRAWLSRGGSPGAGHRCLETAGISCPQQS